MFFKRDKKVVDVAAAAEPAERAEFVPRRAYGWNGLQRHSEITYSEADASALQFLRHPPRFALDIGCNTGGRGAAIKAAYPDAQVWGIEPNAQAAALARDRLDHVINALLGDVNWSAEGVQRGNIDTVLLYDVLEHIYDPWSALLALRNLVASDAQLVVSMPNVQNVMLIEDLVNGTWRYRNTGLLDITHIRFFTWWNMLEMFYQTGFRVTSQAQTFDPRSQAILNAHSAGPFPRQIPLDRWAVMVDSLAELTMLCATQGIAVLQPVLYEQLSAEEKRFVDGPFPEASAYGYD